VLVVYSWMVGAVTGYSEQNVSPVVTELVRHASVVLRHQSTDVTQLVEGGAVQSEDEVVERLVQYHVR